MPYHTFFASPIANQLADEPDTDWAHSRPPPQTSVHSHERVRKERGKELNISCSSS